MNLFNDFQVSVYIASVSSFLITVILCFLLIKYISNFAKSKNTQKRLNDFNIVPLGGVAMLIKPNTNPMNKLPESPIYIFAGG